MRVFLVAIALCLVFSAAPLPAQEPDADQTVVRLVEEAYLAHRRGDLEAAVEGYSKVIQRRGMSTRERAVAYLLRGEAQRDLGRADEAVLDFTRAVRQWERYPAAYYFRGQIYEKQGKLVEAYADLAQAHDLDPERDAYANHLAILRKKMDAAGLILQESGAIPQPEHPPLPAE